MDAIYTFQTNVRFNKDKYNIKFKEIELQLFNGGKEYQDYIRLSYDSLKEEEIYFILTEFLSCLSLSLDAIFIPPSYNISPTYISQNPKPSEKRQIICTKNERHDFIPLYALINERQITLARLYRIANSANDIYMKILFYWHCLVYPNQKENDAINFLNDLHPQNIPRDMKLLPETLECILEDNHFKSKGKQLGNYIQKEIRHAIAHIKREKNEYTELELDNIQQIRHLNTILKVLKATARYRLLYLERIIDNTDISEYFHIQAN